MSGIGAAVPPQRLVNIQILRGVAALLVVVAHSVDMSESVAGAWGIGRFGQLENVGAFGVDLFFVISGFVMAHSVAGRRGGADARRFLVRRWIRIAPPYLLVGLLMIPIDEAHRVAVTLRGVANLVLFVPVLDTDHYSEPPLDVGWTLSFEFTFYLVVALVVLLGLARRLWLLLPVFLLLAGGGALVHPSWFPLAWLLNPIFIEFGLGVAVHLLWRSGVLARAARPVLVLGVLALLALAVELVIGIPPISESAGIQSGALSGARVLLWGLPATAVFAAAVALPADPRSRRATGWRALGDASYSVYLVHMPTILVVGFVLKHLPTPGPVALVLGVAAGVAAGFPFHRWVERPLTRALNLRYDSVLQRRAVV